MTIYGPSWPLSTGEKDVFEMNSNSEQQVLFELKNIILTSPGENLSDPNFGVGIRNYLFEGFESSMLSDLEISISTQLSTYLPELSIVSINLFSNSTMQEEGSLGVSISYVSPSNNLVKTMDINMFNESERIF